MIAGLVAPEEGGLDGLPHLDSRWVMNAVCPASLSSCEARVPHEVVPAMFYCPRSLRVPPALPPYWFDFTEKIYRTL